VLEIEFEKEKDEIFDGLKAEGVSKLYPEITVVELIVRKFSIIRNDY
jgi:hypothetical protein